MLYADLTVFETLYFAAQLRLPNTMTRFVFDRFCALLHEPLHAMK